MKLCHRVSFVFLQQRHRVRGHFGLKNSACVSCGMRQRRLAAVGGHLCPACLQPPLPLPAAGSAQEQRPCCSGSCTPPSGQAQGGRKEAYRTPHAQNSHLEYVRHFHKARLENKTVSCRGNACTEDAWFINAILRKRYMVNSRVARSCLQSAPISMFAK